MFYVLCIQGEPWVLDKFDTRQRAIGAIRWQGDTDGRWIIAKRTGADTFISADVDRRPFTVGRGPYTAEAFDAFKAEWKP